MISCMLFGQFRYLSVHTGHWWSVLRLKVLYCSEQCSASISTGNGVLWDSEGRKRFLSPLLSSLRLTFYSTCHRNLYQIRWSDDSDLWHWSRWWGQSPKCRGRSGKEVQKTIIYGYAFPPRADVCFKGKCWIILCQSVERRAHRFKKTLCKFAYSWNR